MATPPDLGSSKGKLPQWLLPAIALLAITVIVTVAVFSFLANPYRQLGILPTEGFLYLLLASFVASASWVLGIASLIYVFNWLREARVLLRQIETNTRPPITATQPAERMPRAPWLSGDAKYMPNSSLKKSF